MYVKGRRRILCSVLCMYMYVCVCMCVYMYVCEGQAPDSMLSVVYVYVCMCMYMYVCEGQAPDSMIRAVCVCMYIRMSVTIHSFSFFLSVRVYVRMHAPRITYTQKHNTHTQLTSCTLSRHVHHHISYAMLSQLS